VGAVSTSDRRIMAAACQVLEQSSDSAPAAPPTVKNSSAELAETGEPKRNWPVRSAVPR
jgi:hypothetical protein